MIGKYATGDLWITKDGKRTIVIQGEGAQFRGERMFLVRTVSNKHTQYGRLGGSRLLSMSGLLRKYQRVEAS